MAIYRDLVPRVSLRDIRLRYKPSVFKKLDQVHLEYAGVETDVSLVRVNLPTVFGGSRVALRCPSCGRSTYVVGCVPGIGWQCAGCSGWRGRDKNRIPRPLGSV